MPPLIFNAPPIDHEAANLGDCLHTTSDGIQIPWQDLSLWHLMGAYKVLRDKPGGHDEWVSRELADLKRYIEYRTSIGNVHGV